MARPRLHPAEKYARDVLRGRIKACKWVKLACQRHLDDLKHGHERGLYFDRGQAEKVLEFFSLLRHSKGEWEGQTFELEPWEQFILWVVFGWYRDGSERWIIKIRGGGIEDSRWTRRFRTLFLSVGRKNGKSTLAAGIGLFMLSADREPGAEIYTYATKKDQARIIHAEAIRMVRVSRQLSRRLTVYRDNIHIKKTASKFEPLGSDEKTMDGLNLHCGICDEIHVYPNRIGWDKLRTGTRSRRQPLMVGVTTSGNDRQSFCYEMDDYTRKVVSGKVTDDSFFGIIFTLDEGDDWQNEKNWIKANPNLGVSKYLTPMREDAAMAREMPSFLNSFKQLDLNLWVQSSVAWIPEQHWSKCAGIVPALDLPKYLAGRTCNAGLDLASVSDIAAFVMDFPPEEEEDVHYTVCRFWVPEDTVIQRSKSEGVKYNAWVEQGYIEATPGNVIDYKHILAQVARDAETFELREIAYDRYGAANIVQTLQDDMGLTVVQMGQGFLSMSAPMKELERLIKSHKIIHGGHPVLTWMSDNVVAEMDAAGNIKPSKDKSKEKIDGITALVMAVARSMAVPPEKKSRYEEEGIRMVG